MFKKVTDIKYDNKMYHIYKYTDTESNISYIIKGRTQDGNDFILRNFKEIFKKYLNLDLDVNMDVGIVRDLIWLHGDGPSPHFILYRDDNIKLDSRKLELFIKSMLPEKSNKNEQLSCSFLSDVKMTNVKGLVIVKSKKLNKLLL